MGYGVATIVGLVLALHWDLDVGERMIALIGPPAAFVITITIATALKGRDWIVFYQALFAAIAVVTVLGAATGAHVWRIVDITVLGIGVFLVFGRIGCFHVACCHGRPGRRGVIYGAAHVAAGFWGRLADRPLIPVQLIESAVSLLLVIGALACSGTPGTASIVYGTGYATARWFLELLRGDPARPHAHGVSEAQWTSGIALVVCAMARPAWWTIGPLAIITAGTAFLVSRRRVRELLLPSHLVELDRLLASILTDPARTRRDTRCGVGASVQDLPDGRRDWILSSTHPGWSVDVARAIADALWTDVEIVEGRTPGVVHVIEG